MCVNGSCYCFRAAACAIFVSGGVSGACVDTPEDRCLLSGQSSEADGVWVRGICLLPTFLQLSLVGTWGSKTLLLNGIWARSKLSVL